MPTGEPEQRRQGAARTADRAVVLPSWLPVSLVCAASAVTLVILGTRLTFFNDDWSILLQRPGLTAKSVFAPNFGNLVALPVLVYKGLVGLFGLHSQLPFRIVLAGTVASLGIMVYVLVSERVGRLLALAAAAIVVFLGSAWEDLLWSFQIGFIGSLATGLAVLLALERDTPRRNAIACFLLVCSVSLSNVGLPFVAAAVVAVLLRRRPIQLWIPAIPAALFGVWWIFYGSEGPSSLTGSNLGHLPKYILDSAASGLYSIAGRPGQSGSLAEGRALLAIVVVGLVVWMLRGGRPSSWVLIVAVSLFTFWILTGANFTPGREPNASRYQLADATLLILISAELFREVRVGPVQLWAVLAIAVVALSLNVLRLRGGYGFMREQSAYARADLGALQITRGRAPSSFRLLNSIAHVPTLAGVTAGRYFAETHAHGSPNVYSPAQIAAAPPAQRQAADSVIAAAYGLATTNANHPRSLTGCRRYAVGAGGTSAQVEIPSGGALLTDLGKAQLGLGVRRFAPPSVLPVFVGFVHGGDSVRLVVPRDSLAIPWHLATNGQSTLEVCPRIADVDLRALQRLLKAQHKG